ncbi:MAG TPA: branched-chain amino acid ABC transporter permease [Candidatus Dormibacteraeota bacterium]
MQELIQQIVSGLANGGIYASLALALVIIYTAMGLINFAQGEFAMFATFIAWVLIAGLGLPYAVGFAITLVIAFVGAVGIERVIVRPFERGPQLNIVIVTLALFTVTNGAAGFIWGYEPQSFPSPFPAHPLVIGGVYISISNLGIIGVTLGILALVYLFFNRTPIGLAMRAAALYPDSARLIGIRVGWMLALGWGLAAAVGAVSGMLVAPQIVLQPNMMQSVIIYAFAAAVLGGIDSPVGAVVGGLILGVALALVGAYIQPLADLRLPLSLGLIVVLLVVKPSGLFGHRHVVRV